MPSPKELAKALARQDSVTEQPRNRFLGAIADAAGYVSDQADRYVVPERDPLFGGMRGGDLLPLRNVNRLLDDLSYGGRITTGRGQTTTLRPEVVDTVGLGAMLTNPLKKVGIAAAMKAAEHIENRTGFARLMPDTRMGITTWHGSPHTFPPTANNPLGEFDPMKVGTGEGAQAYGVGAGYLAEAKDLAKRYQENLSKGQEKFFVGGKEVFSRESGGQPFDISDPKTAAIFTAARDGEKAARKSFKNQGDWGKKAIAELDLMKGQQITREAPGNLYKVDLPDEHVAKMLDWDKPLSEQHPSVQSALAKLDPDLYHPTGNEYSPDEVGAEIYLRMANSPLAKNQFDASEVMRNAGITGIRYLDAASRDAAGKGTSNFVVFDPKHMNILERNGVGGAMIPRPKTEFEILHDTAQRNAALPVEQGGLGLPANNTYIDRANAPGMWPDDGYHGSMSDIKKFKENMASTESHAGRGTYITDSPEDASLNYANIYGPDVQQKVELSMEQLADDRNSIDRIARRFRDENLTPGQQEVLLANTTGADNLGVVYPLRYRSDMPVHLDKPQTKETSVGPFQKYDEEYDDYTDTPAAGNLANALREYEYAGGDSSHIHDVLADAAGESVPAQDIYRAAMKGSNNMMDEDTGNLVSGGVAASDFLRHFGVDQIAHTPQFRNQQLNIGTQHTVAMKPENVRSRFAAFDPMRRHEADILAGVGVGGMLDPQAIAEALRQQDRK